jgi:hypothetical protein
MCTLVWVCAQVSSGPKTVGTAIARAAWKHAARIGAGGLRRAPSA